MNRLETLLRSPWVQDLIRALGRDQVRLVGGCVRDSLMELDVKDIDACTPLTPKDVSRHLKKDGKFSVHLTGIAHGTITAHHLKTQQNIQITTLRQDVSTDGRRATVAFSTSWQEDAARRDFTFNALMLNENGQVYDYFTGLRDLEIGQVRFIGQADQRLQEDWLRALRYFRFWGRFGKIDPNEQEAEALRRANKHLNHLSTERIWHELKGLIQTPNAANALSLFKDLGFADALSLQFQPAHFTGLNPVAAWAGLLGPNNDDFLIKMKASKAEQHHFGAVRAALKSPDSRFARQVSYGHEATQAAEQLSGRSPNFPPPPDFPIKAKDLFDLGHVPGAQLGQTLNLLKHRWISAEGQVSKAILLDGLNKSTT